MASQEHAGKIALVTGANKGIGLEIARQLGKRGVRVLVGARDAGRGKAAADALKAEGIDARFVELDVTNQATIDAAAKLVEKEFGKLDILVNNAGIAIERDPPSTVPLDAVRKTYDTNVFGVIALTQAMLPLIKKSAAGRIVNLSSGLGSLAQHSGPNSPFANFLFLAYNSSKTALNAVTVQFANELRNTPIKVNAADPGYVATDLNNHSGPRTVEQGATAPVRLALLDADGPTGGYFNEDGVVPW